MPYDGGLGRWEVHALRMNIERGTLRGTVSNETYDAVVAMDMFAGYVEFTYTPAISHFPLNRWLLNCDPKFRDYLKTYLETKHGIGI